jgi:hypothetical protein
LTMRASSPRDSSPVSTGSADGSEATHDSSIHIELACQDS